MGNNKKIRNSTVDFLIFTKENDENGIEVRVENKNIWLTQQCISMLYDVDRTVITKHLKNIFIDGELDEKSVCAIFAHTANDGKTYNNKYYSLDAFLKFNDEEVLNDFGKVKKEVADSFAISEYEKYRKIQDKSYKSDFDMMIEECEKENIIKKRNISE